MNNHTINILNKISLVILGALLASAIFLFLFSGLWKYRAINKALEEVSKPAYNVTAYNCVDFSRDAVATLEAKNIDSNIIVIKEDPTSSNTHAVIGVWIDPQNGQFVSNAQYVGDYSELKNQYGWAK